MKSKIYLALTVLLLLTSLQTNAQDELFGLKGGLNISNFGGSASDGLTPKIGFHIGGFASLPLSKRITYQPEVTFSREGNEFKDLEEAKADFDYLNITPLLFKFFPTNSGLNIQSGLQIGILLSAKSFNEDEELDIKEFYSDENASAILGIGYQYSNYTISVRYNVGIYSILRASQQDDKLLPKVFQLSVGLGF